MYTCRPCTHQRHLAETHGAVPRQRLAAPPVPVRARSCASGHLWWRQAQARLQGGKLPPGSTAAPDAPKPWTQRHGGPLPATCSR